MKNYIISLALIIFLVIIATWAYQWQGNSNTPEQIQSEPSVEITAQIQSTIRDFMDNPDLTIRYIASSQNPSNFTVGTTTQLDDGGWRTDTPAGWQRPVFIFQQDQYIDELCEVYEYEIDARNNQIVDIHVRYPEAIQELSMDEIKSQCSQYGSLYIPTKTQAKIETVAMNFLSRNLPSFDQLKDDFIYKPSKENPINVAAAHEWIWQDTDYQLPKGLTGDVYNYPTIRVIFSSGGRLIHYFNSVGLFA